MSIIREIKIQDATDKTLKASVNSSGEQLVKDTVAATDRAQTDTRNEMLFEEMIKQLKLIKKQLAYISQVEFKEEDLD